MLGFRVGRTNGSHNGESLFTISKLGVVGVRFRESLTEEQKMLKGHLPRVIYDQVY